MSACANISSGIAFDCDNPLVSGVDAENLFLINRADIESITLNATNKHIAEAITLKAGGTQAYKFEGFSNSVRPSGENVTEGFNKFKFTHTIEFRIFDRSAPTKEQVRAIVAGDLVAIYFRKGKTIEIMGSGVGLTSNTVTFNEYEEESAYLMTLATDTDNGDFESYLPLTYNDGVSDFNTLKTQIEALLTPTT